jgi:hypothetical protein
MMKVEFYYPTEYLYAAEALRFNASVDGELISCVVSVEQLYHLLGTFYRKGEVDAVETFNRHRADVEQQACDQLSRQGIPPVNRAGRRELHIAIAP